MSWKKFTGEPLQNSLFEEVEFTIQKEKNLGNNLKVCIGTDSQVKGSQIHFATVITFLRQKNGGFMFIHQDKTKNHLSIKQRMLLEVQKSIETAHELRLIFEFHEIDFEIHADINTQPRFKSYEALQEAIGYIIGMGFNFKAKPDAFASTSCANKWVQ